MMEDRSYVQKKNYQKKKQNKTAVLEKAMTQIKLQCQEEKEQEEAGQKIRRKRSRLNKITIK